MTPDQCHTYREVQLPLQTKELASKPLQATVFYRLRKHSRGVVFLLSENTRKFSPFNGRPNHSENIPVFSSLFYPVFFPNIFNFLFLLLFFSFFSGFP